MKLLQKFNLSQRRHVHPILHLANLDLFDGDLGRVSRLLIDSILLRSVLFRPVAFSVPVVNTGSISTTNPCRRLQMFLHRFLRPCPLVDEYEHEHSFEGTRHTSMSPCGVLEPC